MENPHEAVLGSTKDKMLIYQLISKKIRDLIQKLEALILRKTVKFENLASWDLLSFRVPTMKTLDEAAFLLCNEVIGLKDALIIREDRTFLEQNLLRLKQKHESLKLKLNCLEDDYRRLISSLPVETQMQLKSSRSPDLMSLDWYIIEEDKLGGPDLDDFTPLRG
jgi:hypothetical protein